MEDDEAYIVAYLTDEACSISEEQILTYIKDKVEITEDNIHLYYKYMSDYEKLSLSNNNSFYKEKNILTIALRKRAEYLTSCFSFDSISQKLSYVRTIDYDYSYSNKQIIIGMSWFGVVDTFEPIQDYLDKIRESEQYNVFSSECRCNNCMTYFESDDDLEKFEDEDGEFLGCPKCKKDSYLMDLTDSYTKEKIIFDMNKTVA